MSKQKTAIQTAGRATTRFQKDLADALQGNEIEVITARRAELGRLRADLRGCKNGFRAQCILQEINRLTRELAAIEANF